VKQLRSCLAPANTAARSADRATTLAPPSLTFKHTASRAFEEDYWNTIAHLSTGDYGNKNNADCVLDKPTQALLAHHHRDLEGMGDYLLDYYARLIASYGMADAFHFG